MYEFGVEGAMVKSVQVVLSDLSLRLFDFKRGCCVCLYLRFFTLSMMVVVSCV